MHRARARLPLLSGTHRASCPSPSHSSPRCRDPVVGAKVAPVASYPLPARSRPPLIAPPPVLTKPLSPARPAHPRARTRRAPRPAGPRLPCLPAPTPHVPRPHSSRKRSNSPTTPFRGPSADATATSHRALWRPAHPSSGAVPHRRPPPPHGRATASPRHLPEWKQLRSHEQGMGTRSPQIRRE